MSDYYILNEQGEAVPCDVNEWSAMYADRESRRIARDEIDNVLVSTVFLGLDHSWGEGPPLIFETMVFGGTLDEEQERYSTRAEALAGHAAWVERVKSGTPREGT